MPTLSGSRKMQTKTVMRAGSSGEARRAPGLESPLQRVLSDPGAFPRREAWPAGRGRVSALTFPQVSSHPEREWDPCPFPSCPHQWGYGGEDPPVSGRSLRPPFSASSLGCSPRSQPGHLGCKNIFSVQNSDRKSVHVTSQAHGDLRADYL